MSKMEILQHRFPQRRLLLLLHRWYHKRNGSIARTNQKIKDDTTISGDQFWIE